MPARKPLRIGEIKYPSLSAACAALGHSMQKINHRVRAGMSLHEAFEAKDRVTGAKQHPSYSCWNAMRSRCYSEGSAGYERYGATGISVCARWKDDFWAFVEDMGVRPSRAHTVDRVENSKGYEPGNCRWATRKEQGRNRRDCVKVGEHATIADAADAIGMARRTLNNRLNSGMTVAEALSKPLRHTRRKAIKREQEEQGGAVLTVTA